MKVRTPLADSYHDDNIVVGSTCSDDDGGGSWDVLGEISDDRSAPCRC